MSFEMLNPRKLFLFCVLQPEAVKRSLKGRIETENLDFSRSSLNKRETLI